MWGVIPQVAGPSGATSMKRFFSPILGVAVVLSSGCASMNNTEKGALGGGALGAGAGAIIGSALGHHAGAGALIGGGLGALAGGGIGHGIDKSEAHTQPPLAAASATVQRPLGLTDILQIA